MVVFRVTSGGTGRPVAETTRARPSLFSKRTGHSDPILDQHVGQTFVTLLVSSNALS